MNRQDDLLRKACEMLAEEETQRLEDSLTSAQIHQADALYRQHRMKIFALISKNTRKKNSYVPWLKAAACLILILGAAWIALRQQSLDPTPLTPPPGPTFAPYYTAVPSSVPLPTHSLPPVPAASYSPAPSPSPHPTAAPAETPIPTNTPIPTIFPSPSPTSTPIPIIFSVEASTPSPLFDQQKEKADPEEIGSAPSGWAGSYYPQFFPDGYHLAETEEGMGSQSVIYTAGTQSITFTEYDRQQPLSIPADAQLSYIQLGNHIALKMETEKYVTLAWEMEGHTLIITCTEADAEKIAADTKKVLK